MLGMKPSEFRADAKLRFAIAELSLGAVLVAMSEKGVCAIPLGSTATCSEIVRRLGQPKSARAAAQACAANPTAQAAPCHRVVRSDGSLSGYRCGVERKRKLLEREAQAAKSAKKRPRKPLRP
jgi:O-6-methylguanine DNA methyltransferase